MRLLVVSGSPPDISRSVLPVRSSTAQPPGPGFPRHAPSVNISTSGRSLTSGNERARELENHAFGRVVDHFLGDVETRRKRVNDFADEDFRRRRSGGDSDGARLAEPVPIDVTRALDEACWNAETLGHLGET